MNLLLKFHLMQVFLSGGAACNNIRTGGTFGLDEMEYHINAKELLAAKSSLKTFVKVPAAHVKLLSANATTVHYINNMHSNKSSFHYIINLGLGWGQKHLDYCLLHSKKREPW